MASDKCWTVCLLAEEKRNEKHGWSKIILALPFKQFSSMRLAINTSLVCFRGREGNLYFQVSHVVAEESFLHRPLRKSIKWISKNRIAENKPAFFKCSKSIIASDFASVCLYLPCEWPVTPSLTCKTNNKKMFVYDLYLKIYYIYYLMSYILFVIV